MADLSRGQGQCRDLKQLDQAPGRNWVDVVVADEARRWILQLCQGREDHEQALTRESST